MDPNLQHEQPYGPDDGYSEDDGLDGPADGIPEPQQQPTHEPPSQGAYEHSPPLRETQKKRPRRREAARGGAQRRSAGPTRRRGGASYRPVFPRSEGASRPMPYGDQRYQDDQDSEVYVDDEEEMYPRVRARPKPYNNRTAQYAPVRRCSVCKRPGHNKSRHTHQPQYRY